MKVKIIKCSSKIFWYSDMIGEILDVKIHKYENKESYVYKTDEMTGFLQVDDCVILRQIKLERILNEKSNIC